MGEIDQVIDGLNRISLLAQLRDKVFIAREAGRRKCGSCQFWMKSRECPREHNVNGWNRGPSCEDLACNKYHMTDRAHQLQLDKVQEAIEFAQQHRLPVPSHEREGGAAQ